jgi:methionine aminopeptidase
MSKSVECVNFATNMGKKIYQEIRDHITKGLETSETISTYEVSEFGNNRIREELEKVYKKCKTKGIAFPVSVSLNNCVGNYVARKMDIGSFSTIKSGDIVKIEFGISVGDHIGTIGETFIAGSDKQSDFEFLDTLQGDIIANLKAGETNDTLRQFIESECVENGFFPLENCISYQQMENHPQKFDSKFLILNYRKYYDSDDNLIGETNDCYEFLEDEIYTINITCALSDAELRFKEMESRLFRFNDSHYQLKMASSRAFLSEVKSKHQNFVFDINHFNSPKLKMGMKECLNNGLLEEYPILFTNPAVNIVHKKFTIVVRR